MTSAHPSRRDPVDRAAPRRDDPTMSNSRRLPPGPTGDPSSVDLGDGDTEGESDGLDVPRGTLAASPLRDGGPVEFEPSGQLDVAGPLAGGELLDDSVDTFTEGQGGHIATVKGSLREVKRDQPARENISPSRRDNSADMASPGSKKPYPQGRAQQLTEEWKNLVRRKLTELGKDHRWLEDQIGTGRASVTKMLGADQQTFKKVADVCRVLSIPPPFAALESDDERELVARFRRASPREKRHILATLEMLTASDREEKD